MSIQKQRKLYKQKGATLISALTFLGLMTVVSVSAMKISILDLLVAGNDQKKSLTYLSAESSLSLNTNLYVAYEKKPNLMKLNHMDSNILVKERGTDQCRGTNGQARSIGSRVNDCQLFSISSKSFKQGSVISDTHIRGVGREVPNSNR